MGVSLQDDRHFHICGAYFCDTCTVISGSSRMAKTSVAAGWGPSRMERRWGGAPFKDGRNLSNGGAYFLTNCTVWLGAFLRMVKTSATAVRNF